MGMAHRCLVTVKTGEMFQVMYLEHLIQFGYAWDWVLSDFHPKTQHFVFKSLRSLNSD